MDYTYPGLVDNLARLKLYPVTMKGFNPSSENFFSGNHPNLNNISRSLNEALFSCLKQQGESTNKESTRQALSEYLSFATLLSSPLMKNPLKIPRINSVWSCSSLVNSDNHPRFTSNNSKLDSICVLFNFAVFYSSFSSIEDFQKASFVFDYLRNEQVPEYFSNDAPPADLHVSVLSVASKLMIVQAHSLFISKAFSKPGSTLPSRTLTMKLCAENATLYEEILRFCKDLVPKKYLNECLIKFCESERNRFSAIAKFLFVLSEEETVRTNLTGFGVLVGVLRQALTEAEVSKDSIDLETEIKKKLVDLERDNDYVYHELVQSLEFEQIPRLSGLGPLKTFFSVSSLESPQFLEPLKLELLKYFTSENILEEAEKLSQSSIGLLDSLVKEISVSLNSFISSKRNVIVSDSFWNKIQSVKEFGGITSILDSLKCVDDNLCLCDELILSTKLLIDSETRKESLNDFQKHNLDFRLKNLKLKLTSQSGQVANSIRENASIWVVARELDRRDETFREMMEMSRIEIQQSAVMLVEDDQMEEEKLRNLSVEVQNIKGNFGLEHFIIQLKSGRTPDDLFLEIYQKCATLKKQFVVSINQSVCDSNPSELRLFKFEEFISDLLVLRERTLEIANKSTSLVSALSVLADEMNGINVIQNPASSSYSGSSPIIR